MSTLILAETSLIDYIKNLFESLKDIIKEANFIFTKDGLEIKRCNSDKQIFVSLELNKFEKYEYKMKEDKKEIGINLVEFNKIIKTLSHDDKITFKIESIDEQKLVIIITNTLNCRVSKHVIDSITTNIAKITPKNIEKEAVLSMPSSDFQKVCRDVSNLSDKINIMCIEKKINFSCDSSTGKHKFIYGETDTGRKFLKHCKKIIQNKYKLRYLSKIIKCSNLSKQVKLSMIDGYPMEIEYQVNKLGTIKFWINPDFSKK